MIVEPPGRPGTVGMGDVWEKERVQGWDVGCGGGGGASVPDGGYSRL